MATKSKSKSNSKGKGKGKGNGNGKKKLSRAQLQIVNPNKVKKIDKKKKLVKKWVDSRRASKNQKDANLKKKQKKPVDPEHEQKTMLQSFMKQKLVKDPLAKSSSISKSKKSSFDMQITKESQEFNDESDEFNSEDAEEMSGEDENESSDDDLDFLNQENDTQSHKDSELDDNSDMGDTNFVTSHKKDLQALKTSQPEFYKFLLENDKDLLDFENESSDLNASDVDDDKNSHESENDSMEVDQDSDSENEQENDEGYSMSEKLAYTSQSLNSKTLAELEVSLKKKESFKNIKQLLRYFRAAVQLDNDKKSSDVSILDAKLHNRVIILALTHIPAFLNSVLGVKNRPLKSNPAWKKLYPLAKSFFSNTVEYLKVATDHNTIVFLLQEVYNGTRYLVSFRKTCRSLFKVLLSLWSECENDEIRVKAFAQLRYLADTYPKSFLDITLKGVYLTFIRTCKFTNEVTLPKLTFMLRCAVEVYGLNLNTSYLYAFTYIKQMALHLRNAVTLKTKSSLTMIYNWQFYHSLKFWTHILMTYANKTSKHPLTSLVYPLVQLMCGTIRLVPSEQYHPFHLHLLTSLNDLSFHCGCYIPLFMYYTQILDTIERKPAKAGGSKPLNFEVCLKCPSSHLHTRSYVQQVQHQVYLGLQRFLGIWAGHISFPELAIMVLVNLKSFLKKSRNPTWSTNLKQLIQKIEDQRLRMLQLRQSTELCPKDIEPVQRWMASLDTSSFPLAKDLSKS